MTSHFLISFLILLSFTVSACYGKVHFSSLNNSLIIEASPTSGQAQVLKAGIDKIKVSWVLNPTFPAGTDSAFKTVKVKLCYAPISQKQRGWRKTEDLISKDRTCQFVVITRAYDSAKNAPVSFEEVIKRSVPTATYFIRAYVYDSHDTPLAYGQNTDANRTTHLFNVQGISGRHTSIDICAGVFSAFSVVTLFIFFFKEKRKGRKAAQAS